VCEALGEPALDTLRRHHDKLFGEGVGEWYGKYVTQPVGEQVRTLGTVQVQGHRRSMPRDASLTRDSQVS
jgi:hypothetical protein